MHAISNSEDVPCTKWPPAGAPERGGEAVVYPRRNTPEVEGEGRAPEGAIFCTRIRDCRAESRVGVTQYGGAFEEAGPQQDGSTGEVVVGGGGGGGCSVFARPVQVRQKQKQQQQQQHHRSDKCTRLNCGTLACRLCAGTNYNVIYLACMHTYSVYISLHTYICIYISIRVLSCTA